MGNEARKRCGLRAGTRFLFSRPFRKKGVIPMGVYLKNYKIGDYVDIVANSSIQAGMPAKVYHGRTGKIWNVTKRAVGVEVNKQHREKILRKRIHVRIEHVRPSRCREDFLARVKENDVKKSQAKKAGTKIVTKRKPVEPTGPSTVLPAKAAVETVTPIPYDLVSLLGI